MNSQDYADLLNDLYASEMYKQCLVTEKIIFTDITNVNHTAVTLPDYLQDFANVFFKDKIFKLPPH